MFTQTTSKPSERKHHAIHYLPEINDFKLNTNPSLKLLDSVGWLLYKLAAVFVFLKHLVAPVQNTATQKRIEPPGPEGHAVLGVYPEFAQRGILDFSDQVWKTYGQEGICQFKLGGRQVYLVTDPAYSEKILADTETFKRGPSFESIRHFLGNTSITTEGDIWKQKSRELFPHLSPKKIKEYHSSIVAAGQKTCERWVERATQKQEVDLLEEMSLVTVDVIGRSLLNMDLHSEMHSTGKALNQVLSYIIENFVSALPPWILEKLPTKSTREYKQAIQILKLELRDAIKKYITEGKSTSGYYIDERIEAYRGELDQGVVSRALIDEVMVIFFAGHDTTSKLLTWTLFELAQNPSVSQKLYHEIDTILQDREPTLDDLKDLPYLAKVLQESLRVYPPVSGIVRDVTEDTELGPYLIPKGSCVQIGMRLMGKDPKIWKDPEQFNPERFEDELTNKVGQYDFIPFIAGQHRCPGRHLALVEAKTILIMLIQRFAFGINNQEPIHAVTKVTLHPDKPIRLSITIRPTANRIAALESAYIATTQGSEPSSEENTPSTNVSDLRQRNTQQIQQDASEPEIEDLTQNAKDKEKAWDLKQKFA